MIIRQALEKVLEKYRKSFRCEPTLILVGAGTEAIGIPVLKQLKIKNWLVAKEELNEQALNCFSAYALGILAVQMKTTKEDR